MPTGAPSPIPVNTSLVTASLRTLVNSPQFLAEINNAMHTEIPDNYRDESLLGRASKSVCALRVPRVCKFGVCAGGGCKCSGNYEVSANLQQCSGLKTIQLLRMTDLNSSDFLQGDSKENLTAVIGAELGVGYVECAGPARAELSACGLSPSVSGSATLGLRVKKISAQISAKVVQGTGNNSHRLCLNVTKVLGKVSREDIVWERQELELGTLPGISMPSTLKETLWTKLPLDSVVNRIENVGIKQLQDVLKDEAPCF
jgi:hypothetical protein